MTATAMAENETSSELREVRGRVAYLEDQMDAVSRAVKIVLGGTVVFLLFRDLILLLNMGRFTIIFSDMLGAEGLPLSTQFLLGFRTYFFVADIFFAVACVASMVLATHPGHAIVINSGIIVAIYCKITFTTYAMFAPLLRMVEVMSQ